MKIIGQMCFNRIIYIKKKKKETGLDKYNDTSKSIGTIPIFLLAMFQ